MTGVQVHVVIPVYNCKEYLEEAVHSVLSQPYTSINIVIVDDGSADGSYEFCDFLARQDERIHVIHQENKGVSSARNAGIEYVLHQKNAGVSAARNNGMAAADNVYVAFCDAADAWAADFFDQDAEELLGRGYDILSFQHHIGDHTLENLQWIGNGESDAVHRSFYRKEPVTTYDP